MPITRDRLEARREEIKLQQETFRQQYIAATGALADIDFWLAEEAAAQPGTEPVEKD